jgi:hypothetical protein
MEAMAHRNRWFTYSSYSKWVDLSFHGKLLLSSDGNIIELPHIHFELIKGFPTRNSARTMRITPCLRKAAGLLGACEKSAISPPEMEISYDLSNRNVTKVRIQPW